MPKKVVPPPPPTQRATKSPSSAADKISPLAGDLDMSMPVADATKISGVEVLPARAFPHYLRRSGWIYLRCQDQLQARVKASKLVWEETRIDLSDPTKDLGAGLAIKVDPSTWETDLGIELGGLAERQRDGFRYLLTNSDDTITHYMGGRPVTETNPIDLD